MRCGSQDFRDPQITDEALDSHVNLVVSSRGSSYVFGSALCHRLPFCYPKSLWPSRLSRSLSLVLFSSILGAKEHGSFCYEAHQQFQVWSQSLYKLPRPVTETEIDLDSRLAG